MTFGEKVTAFLTNLEFNGSLPEGISVMNPYRDNPRVNEVITEFYTRFCNDERSRHLILGINPGRFGAGVTGIPFTDTRRLAEKCGISIQGVQTFEPSSAFVYEMIDAFGGVKKFYSYFYISAISPLGFTSSGRKGKDINFNFYDNKYLNESVYEFIIQSLDKQMDFGIYRDVCFCLGAGKNYKFLNELNSGKRYFEKIIPLEHPRFIIQYKSKQKTEYINKYIEEFSKVI